MEKAKNKGKKRKKKKRKESERQELRDGDRDRDREYRDPSWLDSEARVDVAVTERDREQDESERVRNPTLSETHATTRDEIHLPSLLDLPSQPSFEPSQFTCIYSYLFLQNLVIWESKKLCLCLVDLWCFMFVFLLMSDKLNWFGDCELNLCCGCCLWCFFFFFWLCDSVFVTLALYR